MPPSAARNVLYGFLSWILPLGLTFVATPFIFRKLGDEQYGLYALVTSFISYSFTFNIGRAVTKYVAEFVARGERGKIPEVLSATLFINLAVGTFGGLIFIFASHWLVSDVLLIKDNAEVVVSAFYVAAVCIWLTMLGQVYSAILQALHRFDWYSGIFTAGNFLQIAGNIFLAYFGYGFVALIIWNTINTLLTTAIFFTAARKILPETTAKFSFDRQMLKTVAFFSASVTLYQLFGNILLIFERSWITRTLGSEALTYYSLPMNLAIYIHVFITSITFIIFPLTSELYAQGALERLENLYRRATKIIFALVFLAVTVLVFAARSFLTAWIGADFADQAAVVFSIHIVVFGVLAAQIVWWQTAEGTGNPFFNALGSIIWLAVSIPLIILWTENYGIQGTAAARLAGLLPMTLLVFAVEKKVFGAARISFWLPSIMKLAFSAIIAGVGEYLWFQKFSGTFALTFGGVLCGASLFTASLWLTKYLSADERQTIYAFARKVRQK